MTPVTRSVDLETFQSHGSGPVVAGAAVAFTSTVANAGPSTATGVVLTQTVPAGLTGAAVEVRGASGSCAIAGGVARCTVAALPAGAQVDLVLRGTVAAGAAGTTLRPVATAQAAEPDADPADDQAVDPATATAVSDLGVSTTRVPAGNTVFAGSTASVALNVHNDGPSDATGVVVTKQLPAAAEVVDLDPRCTVSETTVTCVLGTVAVGETVSIDLRVRARRPFAGGLLGGGATVHGDAGDPVAANDALASAADLTAACSSARRFPITLRFRRGLRVTRAVVRVDGHRAAVRRRAGRWTAVVDLRGSTKAQVSVRIAGRTRAGRRITGTRVYHPCAPKAKPAKPPRI